MNMADAISMPGASPAIIAMMILLLAAAAGVFWMLTRRWVHSRQMGALYDWARANSMKLDRHGDLPLPEVLVPLAEQPHPLLTLHNEQTLIMQLHTDPSGAQLHPQRWNILLHYLPRRWPATALRPADAPQTFIDFFALPAIAGLDVPERFILHGEDRTAASRLAGSSVGTLLPPGIGLLLIGDYLLLDFSTRPFDGTEFTRLQTVANQVASQLPS